MRSFNIKFPLIDDKDLNTYFKMNYVTKDVYASDLLLLLLTEKGERYYEPDYGCSLMKHLFDPNDETTMGEIENDIKDTVKKYIPKLTINNVNFKTYEDDPDVINEHQLNINIKFTYDEGTFYENGELNINF